jgi:hypothetical protein
MNEETLPPSLVAGLAMNKAIVEMLGEDGLGRLDLARLTSILDQFQAAVRDEEPDTLTAALLQVGELYLRTARSGEAADRLRAQGGASVLAAIFLAEIKGRGL